MAHHRWQPIAAAGMAATIFCASQALAAGRLAVAFVGEPAGPETEVLAEQLRDELRGKGLDIVLTGPASSASAQAASEAAARSGCDLLALGRVDVVGYRIDAELVDSGTGQSLARETATGSREQVFDLIDEIGRAMVRQVGGVLLSQRTVAVLDFRNQASAESTPFVSGIPQMLLTSLQQHEGLTLIEPREVARARVALDSSGAGPPGAAETGRWLGADAAVTGVFTEQVRISVELLTASTGRRLASTERRGLRSDARPAVADLAHELAAVVDGHRRTTRTVAVLPFQNHDEDRYDRFVNGIADMLTTSLGQAERFTVIERVQIETAMRNFNLELSGPIDSETAVEVGAWLGADAVVLGSFVEFGGVFRLDARLIDAATGEVLAAESQRGAEAAVVDMVDDLGHELLGRFDEREPTAPVGTGSLHVVFRVRKSEMGERPVYHHICKLYVDGTSIGQSQVVNGVVEGTGDWVLLFDQSLRAGDHRVQTVHGYVKAGKWDGRMPEQPRGFHVVIEPGSTTTVQYTYEVGWFADRYIYEGAWADAGE